MALYTTEVNIDVDLEDFKDDELIEELVSRGFMVLEEWEGHTFEATLDALRQGRREEGLILLERAIPELKGLLLKG